MTHGEELQALRSALGLTQADAAERVGVSRKTLANWEHDDYGPKERYKVLGALAVLREQPVTAKSSA